MPKALCISNDGRRKSTIASHKYGHFIIILTFLVCGLCVMWEYAHMLKGVHM